MNNRVQRNNWLGRSLKNYKEQQAGIAESKGVLDRLKMAKTLTQARKIVYGVKRKGKQL